jgi:hypothetical protein
MLSNATPNGHDQYPSDTHMWKGVKVENPLEAGLESKVPEESALLISCIKFSALFSKESSFYVFESWGLVA